MLKCHVFHYFLNWSNRKIGVSVTGKRLECVISKRLLQNYKKRLPFTKSQDLRLIFDHKTFSVMIII